MKLARIAKAVMAAAVACLGSLNVALVDNKLTAKELIEGGIVTLAALGATFAVPNADATSTAQPAAPTWTAEKGPEFLSLNDARVATFKPYDGGEGDSHPLPR